MKLSRQSVVLPGSLRLFRWLILFVLSSGTLSAYDPPDFTPEIFSADGIFLPEDQKVSLVEALAALASNFPENPRVDDDLREKALALALRLDPLHSHSRLAHRELSNAAVPSPIRSFEDLDALSDTLWNLATRLSSPPLEPEHLRLAPYLMELSLLAHPDPPRERLEYFAPSADPQSLKWETFTKLQPGSNPSTARAGKIREKSHALLAQNNRELRSQPETLTPDQNPPEREARPMPTLSTPIEPLSGSVLAISTVSGDAITSVAGTVTLTLRTPQNRKERDDLEEKTSAALIPLISSGGAMPVADLQIPMRLANERSWVWPNGALGEITFSPTVKLSGIRRSMRADAHLFTGILIESVLQKKPVNTDFIVAGTIDGTSGEAVLHGDLLETIQMAAASGRKFLLLPASVKEGLVTYLLKSGNLGILFTTEILSYPNLGDAMGRATSPTDPALIEASLIFGEIEEVSARMSLTDLARNAKVQERLQVIVTTCPYHLSARAMLEYGIQPETPEMLFSQFVELVDTITQPFVAIDDPDPHFDALKIKVEPAKLELSRLRAELPLEAREFLAAAEDLVAASEAYLGLSNKYTANGSQRLREATAAINLFESQRAKLGLSSPVEE